MASSGTNGEDVDEGMTSSITTREDGRQEPREMQNLAGGGENQDNDPFNVELRNLEDTVNRIEKSLELLLKYAFVLVNLYYFFQGIVLTAVSQVSSPKCHQRSFFFVLSLIPFFLNGLPLIHVGNKYVKAKIEKDRYSLRREQIRSTAKAVADAATEQMRNAQNQDGGQQQPAVAFAATEQIINAQNQDGGQQQPAVAVAATVQIRNAQNQDGGQQQPAVTVAARNAQNQNGGQQQQPAVAAAATDSFRYGLYYLALAVSVILLAVFNGVVLYGCHSLLCENNTNIMNSVGGCFQVCNNQKKCLNICTQ